MTMAASSSPTMEHNFRLPRVSSIGAAAEPLLALLARTADPDLALASLVRLVEAVRETAGEADAEAAPAMVDDEGTAMRLLSVLGAGRGARRPPVPAPRPVARAHRPDDGLDPPRGVRRPRGPAARRGGRPARGPAHGHPAR